jgi:hypothetical protein
MTLQIERAIDILPKSMATPVPANGDGCPFMRRRVTIAVARVRG